MCVCERPQPLCGFTKSARKLTALPTVLHALQRRVAEAVGGTVSRTRTEAVRVLNLGL